MSKGRPILSCRLEPYLKEWLEEYAKRYRTTPSELLRKWLIEKREEVEAEKYRQERGIQELPDWLRY